MKEIMKLKCTVTLASLKNNLHPGPLQLRQPPGQNDTLGIRGECSLFKKKKKKSDGKKKKKLIKK